MNATVKKWGLRIVTLGSLLVSAAAFAQSGSPGITPTEIRIGQTMPYSGPASAYGTIGRAMAAYLAKINDEGGINGRKLTLISLDDAYSPPKALEQTRKLVEQENVAFMFGPLGTGPNRAITKYLNTKKVPHLFITISATGFADPVGQPWTLGFGPTVDVEARVIAQYLLKEKPAAKIGVLYQNDDFGKSFLDAFRAALGEKAKAMLVSEQSHETSDPTIDSQILSIKAAGADVVISISTPKFSSQAIRKIADLNWKPQIFLSNGTSSVAGVLKPAGLENSVGVMSTQFFKDPGDPRWDNDPGMKEWREFMRKYYPEGSLDDALNVRAVGQAAALVHVLRQVDKDNMTRENIMKAATNIKDLQLSTMLPGVLMNTSPTNYTPMNHMKLMRFDGVRWVLLD